MSKALKYLLITLGALTGLLVLVAAFIAATFDPNDYKPAIIKLVQDKTQRTLAIPGEIRLTLFPRVGADLGQVSLSERQGTQVFASAERAQLSVALLPMLSRQFVVDRVLVDGLTVKLHKYRDQRSNYDDLLPDRKGDTAPASSPGRAPETSQAVQLDVGGIAITNAHLELLDDTRASRLALSKFNLSTGPLAPGRKSTLELSTELQGDKPRLALTLRVKSDFMPDLATQRYAFSNLSATLQGAAADLSALELKLGIPSLDASPAALTAAALSLDGSVTQGSRALSAKLASALHADLVTQRVELRQLTTTLTLPNPAGGTIALNAKGNASIDLALETAQATLAGQFDSTRFDARLGLTKFAQPAYTFDLALGELDVDRYLAPSPPAAHAAPASTTGTAATQPVDLSALQSLHARGALKIAALKVAKVRATDVRLDLLARGGRLDVSPMSALLYGGNLSGSVSAMASSPPRLATRQTLRNINLGALLQDATGKNPIDGKGDVALDVSASGATVPQLKKGLNGTTSLQLKDGAINGINVAATLRHAKAKIGLGQPSAEQGTTAAQEKTDFTELSGSFKIANGVAHNDDLSAKTPLLRLGGSGDIDLGAERLDYTVKATVVPTLQGQGGPELQELKGLTVPVQLSGPFSAISWRIDFAGMAGELAKSRIEQTRSQVKAETEKRVQEQKDKLQEQLQDQFKGLFGR